jgi:hypothetical protein
MAFVSRFACVSLLSSLVFLGSCGGVSKDAQIAASLQVVLANVIEGYTTKDTASLTVTAKCGAGDDDSGTMTYSVPSGLQNPANLLTFLQNNPGAAVDLPLSFNNCVIRTCGGELTLNGSGAVTLDKDDVLAAALGSGEIPAAFSVKANAATATGILEGSVTFAYKIKAVASSTTLESVTIEDASTPAPLEANGKTFNASELLQLAEGC